MKYKLSAKDVNVFYGDLKALNNININISPYAVTALIGPLWKINLFKIV